MSDVVTRGKTVVMLRRRLEAWLGEVMQHPPREDEHCEFAIVASKGEGVPVFSLEVTRSAWRDP